jgi:peptidoglycan hydrolase CwlO-like protein
MRLTPSMPRRQLAASAIALAGLGAAATLPGHAAGAATLGQLGSQLSQQQARTQSLSNSVGHLSGQISALDSQIALVQSREAAVRGELARDRIILARTRVQLRRERRRVSILKARLARARLILSRQLVSSYEGNRPDLVSVVLESNGFTDLLQRLNFLRRAETQQQALIQVTRAAKARADAAEHRLSKLEASDLRVTNAAAVRARALAGMNAILASKQAAVAQARAAQQNALASSRAKSQQLQSAISRLQAQQAAARRAAAAAAATAATAAASTSSSTTSSAPSTSVSSSSAPSGGWAIPYAIVLCESGGQNLPPNSAGASGYYQIIPSTWKAFGGTGPAAYLASKSEQDAVASRIWNNGAGASNWVCAGIVGIH